MKLLTILIFSGTMAVSASVYSQKTRIDLQLQNSSVGTILKSIEGSSDFIFVYDTELVNTKIEKSISLRDAKIETVLNELFGSSNIAYFIDDRQVFLYKKDDLKQLEQLKSEVQVEQQQKSVSGKVTDQTGASLPGVSVVVKGTTTGVITDSNGNYSLVNIPEGATLQFSFVGMKMQTIPVGNKTTINLVLEEETIGLEEVIAIGYGTQKKINLTGAVSNVTSEVLESRPITTLGQGLQGTVSSLNVTQNNGALGQGSSFNIRGTTSLSGGGPLILVNNVPMDINLVNPSDIDNVTVLKDGASSAIYGARAAYGVILVTTKSGKKRDKPRISLSSNYSINSPVVKVEMMDVMERMAFYNEASMRQSGSLYGSYDEYIQAAIIAHYNDPTQPYAFVHPLKDPNLYSFAANTDWPRELLRDSYPMQQHTVSISGGSDKFDYYTSLGYFYQEGNPRHFDEKYKRYNFVTNLNYDINKWFRIGTKVSINNSNKIYPPRGVLDDDYAETNTNFHHQLFPQLPVYMPDGNYAASGGNVPNVVQIEETGGYRTRDINDSWITGLVKLTPVKHMTFNMDYSFNLGSNNTVDYRRRIPVYNNKGEIYIYNKYFSTSQVTKGNGETRYYAFNAFADYENTFNKKHYLKVMIGFNQENYDYRYFQAKRENLMVETMPYMSLASGLEFATDSESEYAIRGSFSRLNYSFDDRYLFEFSGRYDGTSKFSKSDRFAFFPSVSVGWRIDNEAFFAGLKNSINLLKIRGSYSNLGNQSVSGNYPYIATSGTGKAVYLINGGTPMTVFAPGLVSPTLTWETVTQRDLGVDFAVLNNRLTGTFDIYRRDTKNMLTRSRTLPSVLAVAEPQANAADLKTSGFDLTLDWNHSINKVKYGITFILSDYTSKITKYDNPAGLISDYYVGRNIGEIWGLETGGFFATDEEAAALDQTNISARKRQAGDIWFVNQDDDVKITRGKGTLEDHGDQKIIGNSTPHYSFGFRPNVSWNGFDLEIFFQGIAKRDIVLDNTMFLAVYTNEWTNQSKILADFWTPENTDAYFPRPLYNIGTDVTAVQTHFLQNAAYIRLKQLTFGYTIPANLTTKLGMERIRIYFSGNNLWEVSKMLKIADPEMAGAMAYPLNRAISFGANIDL